ncbi:hydrogenase maturation protease [Streptomyces roseoverticillatus]|uniref:hydrogenase maturation protease n=1 Tax=Streptomyces roseoverticillatus TaxID=66429 RepID=UPI0033F1176B
MSVPSARIVVIGLGNVFRRDDGLGPAVVTRLERRAGRGSLPAGVRFVCCDGEPGRLIDLWQGAGLAVVVDAARARPCRPGRVHRLEPDECPGRRVGAASGHGLGLADAVELARALGRMPDRLVVYAVEGADGGPGRGLSPAVAAAVEPLAQRVEEEITQQLCRTAARTSGSALRRPARCWR